MVPTTVIGSAYVKIVPDDTGFSADAEKGILSKVGGIAKTAAGVFAGAFVAKQGFDFLGGLVKDASESRRVLAQTEQFIKSTGGAANVTAKEVSALADQLSRKTGIDDEQIQSASNIIGTFKGVRNEVGAGNDIFNQATQAVLDLSSVLGGTESSALQVGKALDDPIAGVTALQRAGVKLTDQQKDQVEAFVKSGDVLSAQKIILGEINSQVGGQAAAQATAIDRLKVTYGNLREELGARLLPIVDKVASFLADKLPGALTAAGKALTPLIGQIKLFAGAIKTGLSEDDAVLPIERFAFFLRDTVLPIVTQVFGFVRDNVKPIMIGVAAAFLLAAGPVVAIGAALVLLYTRFSAVRTIISAVADFLTNTVAPAIATVVGFMVEQFGHLADFVRENWAGIQEAIGHVIVFVQALIERFVGTIQAIWRAWGDEILNIVRIVWDQIRNIVETVIGIVSGVIRVGIALINGDWGKAWDAIKDILSTAWEFIKESATNALRLLREIIEGAISGIVEFMGGVPGKIRDGLGDLASFLVSAGEDLIRGLLQGIKNLAGKAAEAAKDVVKGAVNAAKDFLGIGSPSKVFMLIGQQTMQGYALGLDAGSAAVNKSLTRILDAAETQARDAAKGMQQVEDGSWVPASFFNPAPGGGNADRRSDSWFAAQSPEVQASFMRDPSGAGWIPRTGARLSSPVGNQTMILSITGPLVNVEGSIIPGQEAAVAAAAEEAVVRMVRNGTVGREMSNRTAIISRR